MEANRLKTLATLGSCMVFLLVAAPLQASAQAGPPIQPRPGSRGGDQQVPYTFRVTTREVLIDLIARDQKNHPVTDLKESDLQIFEVAGRSQKQLRTISAFRVVDPALEANPGDTPSDGFRLALGGGCAVRTTFHYQVAYQPSADGWKSGYHEVLITTNRAQTTLSYRREYYVGEMDVPAKPRVRNGSVADVDLEKAACYRSETPPSIALKAHLVQTADTDPLRYRLAIEPDSLAFVSLSDEARRVELDYGACTFNAEGHFLNYGHKSAEEVLSPKEYARVLAVGFSTLVDLPRQGDPALIRFVVRDRETGNMGTIDVATTIVNPIELTKSQVKAAKKWEAKQKPETLGSFGSILPKSDSLCGDVYELTPGTRALPDFGTMEAIGALYTYSLNVPYQFDQKGLPGVTSRPEWFGIDYYGEFWAKVAGAYHFKMSSDDGAVLYIDDNSVIDLDRVHTILGAAKTIELTDGRHTIHIRYFQETMHVALILKVQAPGEDFKVFDLRDFNRPAEAQ